MLIEPIVFFDLIIITFVLGLGLVVVVVFYAQTLKKLHDARRDEEKLKTRMHKKIEEDEAQAFNEKSQNALDRQLEIVSRNQAERVEKASLDLLEDYQKTLEELKQDNINVFRNISKDIETYASSEIKDFREILQKETVDSQKIVGQKVEEEYSKTQKELEAYKQEQLKKIDDSIYEMLKNIAEMTIGKALNMPEHQELVIEALERARRELK